jgi:hypothetical protein
MTGSREEVVVRVVIEQNDETKRYAEKWSEEGYMNTHTWWTDGSRSDDGGWEHRRYIETAKKAGSVFEMGRAGFDFFRPSPQAIEKAWLVAVSARASEAEAWPAAGSPRAE